MVVVSDFYKGGMSMKTSNWINSLFGRIAVAGLSLSAIFILGGCGPRGETPTTPNTGNLAVGLAFGSAGSYFCEGSGSVTITPTNGVSQTKHYQFSGTASNTSPGCSTGVMFTDLPPGLVQISCSCGANCTKPITAGQTTNVTIRTDTRTCQ